MRDMIHSYAYTASNCNTLQHAATQALQGKEITIHGNGTHTHSKLLQLTATHCKSLQHWHCRARKPPFTATAHMNTLQAIASHCNQLQHIATKSICANCTHTHTATHYNALQHTATHCNALQHTATQALQGKDITIYGNGEASRSLLQCCCSVVAVLLQASRSFQYVDDLVAGDLQHHCNNTATTLQQHCNNTAKHGNNIATHCNPLQLTARHR